MMADLHKAIAAIADGNWHLAVTNPHPWAVGPVGIGRKAGKVYAFIGPNSQLQAFQKTLRSELLGDKFIAGEVEVRIFIWRQIEKYKTAKSALARSHHADATNMQKGIEDAIQNVLIENDKNVRRITTEIIEQSETCSGAIIIHIAPYVPKWQDEIPLAMIDLAQAQMAAEYTAESDSSNVWLEDSDELFF